MVDAKVKLRFSIEPLAPQARPALAAVQTRRSDIMGSCASGFLTMATATVAAAVVLALNVLLVLQTVGVPLPAALTVAG